MGPHGFRPGLARLVRDDARTPVVSVGSNASPRVLYDKLSQVLDEAPHELVDVHLHDVPRLRVGHSAHVSNGGYIAAAPFLADPEVAGHAATTPRREPSAYSVGWFTPLQLVALDATEPNYRRVPLPSYVAPVEGAQVYASIHGVIGESGQRLSLLPQGDVHHWLLARLPCLRAIGTNHPWPYADAHLRAQIRHELADLGLVTPSGLENLQPARRHPGPQDLPARTPGRDLGDHAVD